MIDLQDLEKIPDEKCQEFTVGQEVLPKDDKEKRVGTIAHFLRSKKDSTVYAAFLKWKFESGSAGVNTQPLSSIKPKSGDGG